MNKADEARINTRINIVSGVNLTKFYNDKQGKLVVLSKVNIDIAKGEKVAIVGRSGSGKSTLLSLLGGIDAPSEGHVLINGQNFHQLPAKQKDRVLNQDMGFVYQFHHLLPEFTALENVAMPLLIHGRKIRDTHKTAYNFLQKVGLADRSAHKPSELSGGERQRVAIARALVNNPDCVLMDEPTGNLDKTTALGIQKLIRLLNEHLNIAFVCATHDMEFAHTMDRVIQVEQGSLESV